MKKLLLGALALFVGVSAFAGGWQEFPMLRPDVTWLTVSNAAFGYTNLASSNSRGTNIVGLTYTNASGRLITVAAGDQNNFLQDIPLFARKDGEWWQPKYDGGTNSGQTVVYSPSPLSITIRLVGKAATAGDPIGFNFVPVYDGDNQSTEAADLWAVAVTPNGTTEVVLSTNVPLYRWPGAKLLRCREVYNTDTSSGAIWLRKVSAVGYVP